MSASTGNIAVFGLLFYGLLSCKKDTVPAPEPPPEPSKWEVIAGHYKVYDTLGAFLYEMDIVHIPNNEFVDSLRFENFDGEFTFTVKQPISVGTTSYYVHVGNIDTLYDSQNKRWKILFDFDGVYDNVWSDDTIHFGFIRTNINYYISDLVPYSSCECKQIAVKQ